MFEESKQMRGQQVAVLKALDLPAAVTPTGDGGRGTMSFTEEAVSVLTSSSLLAIKSKESPSSSVRHKREFIPL